MMMMTTTDLTTMTTEELREMAAAIGAELASREAADTRKPAELRRIICRSKDLNAKGNGPMTTRRVRVPNGSAGWASDMAQDLSGSWAQGSYLAAQRRCTERGFFPVGTIVVEYESGLRGGQKSGPATVRAGVIVSADEDAEHAIHWGLSTKGRGTNVQVQTPAGEWVSV
jgi:hypothetical protein